MEEFKQSERFKELEKTLSCSICNQIFLEPVTLFCQHTFCHSCIIMKFENSTIKCPICEQTVMLPISHNFQVKGIIDKIYSSDYFVNRENLNQKLITNLKLKQKYEIYKQYFNELLKKVSEQNGKFIIHNPIWY